MNQTVNLHLPQFAESDRIHHDDFNDAFSKLDTAIGAIPIVKLKEMTTSAAAAQINFDVSDIDFTQYRKIELFFDAPGFTGEYRLLVNNISDSTYLHMSTSGSGGGTSSNNSFFLRVLSPGRSAILFGTPVAQRSVYAASFSMSGSSYASTQVTAPCTWSNLSAFNFKAESGSLPAGTKVALYGYKK